MGQFLAILTGAPDGAEKPELSDDQQVDFLAAWQAWAEANERAIVDPGAPLFRKARLTADGSEDFEDSKVAYAVVQAATLPDAVALFRSHPHLTLLPGNAIEVIECPSPPGAPAT